MLKPVRLLPLLLAFLPATLQAQSTQADLEARLLHKPLYIRGLWRSDKLHFDSTGKLRGDQARTSFTLSGVDVRKVFLNGGKLVLKGERVGLEFERDTSKRVTFGSSVTIEIDPCADFGPALDLILANSLADLVPAMPSYWQIYAQSHILGKPEPPDPPSDKMTGPGESPAKVMRAADLEFSDAARQLGYGGRSLLRIRINDQGRVVGARVLHPLGLGLDEQALAAIVHYQFDPAKRNGQPVPVEVNFDVQFSN